MNPVTTAPAAGTPSAPPAQDAKAYAGRPSTITVLGWELRKLAAQKRAWLGLVASALAPLILVVAMSLQNTPLPKDIPFGRYIRDSGLAGPLVLLGFGGIFFFPMLTAIVSGDLFSSEDHHGTWKTYLTRSVSRPQVYSAKVLAGMAYALTAMVLMAVVSLPACGLRFGFKPLISLSGTDIGPGRAFGLVVASWALSALPVLAFTAIALAASVLTRNSVSGVVSPIILSFLMQLMAFLSGATVVRHFLLTTQFEAFHGLFHDPGYTAMVTRAVWVSVLYAVPPLVISYRVFTRRDVTGG
jgi:ABC-2 type transport system permease protein